MIGWIFGIVGALGITGAIALFLMAPLVFREVVAVILETVKSIWKTRTGCALMSAGAALLFGWFFFDAQGYGRCQDEWDAAKAEAIQKAARADSAAERKARIAEERALKAEELAETATEKARDAYLAELQKRTDNVCADTDADIKRLRSIR